MTILLLTVGSRGDVQPYVALGIGLQEAGHDVTLCTSARFEPFVTEHGLSFAPLTDGFVEMMDTDLSREAMERMSSLRGILRYAPKLWAKSTSLQRDLIRDAWAATQATDPDVLLFHPKMYAAPHFAERLDIPVLLPFVIPMQAPTAAFPCPGFPDLPSVLPSTLRHAYRRGTYHVVRGATALGTRTFVSEWRVAHGLPASPRFTSLTRTHTGAPIPVLYGFSPHLVPRPSDWPDHVEITGPWTLDTDAPPLSNRITAFLDAGPPPVYVGFGSMSGQAPRDLARTVVTALQDAGVRGILSKGWGGLDVHDLPGTMLAVGRVSHTRLFPHVAAVVHHGGAGTTTAGLRAGRPSVLCPFMADQPFWGRRVQAAGVGPAPLPQTELTAPRLSRAVRRATADPRIRRRARRMGRRMQTETGVARAVRAIERLVNESCG